MPGQKGKRQRRRRKAPRQGETHRGRKAESEILMKKRMARGRKRRKVAYKYSMVVAIEFQEGRDPSSWLCSHELCS